MLVFQGYFQSGRFITDTPVQITGRKIMKIMLLLFILIMINGKIFPGGIKEEQIPNPPAYIQLPDELLGEFIVFKIGDKLNPQKGPGRIRITIYESNKYIVSFTGYDTYGDYYGHITKENDSFCFLPITLGYIPKKTKIILSETGFSFIGDEDQKYFVIRME